MTSSRPPLSLLVPMGRRYSRDAAAAGSPVLSHCTSPSATEEQQTDQLPPINDSTDEQRLVDPSDWMPSPLPPLPPSVRAHLTKQLPMSRERDGQLPRSRRSSR